MARFGRDAVYRLSIVLALGSILAGCSAPPPDVFKTEAASVEVPTGHVGVSAEGLVASYDMSTITSEGLLRDFSGNGLHGRLSGTEGSTSPMGGARVFGAVIDRVELPAHSDFDLDGPLSIAIWFRFDRTGQHQHMIACDDKFAVWLTPEDHVRFVNTLGDGAETQVELSVGAWHNVTGIFRGNAGSGIDSTNVEIWIDGSQTSSAVGSAFLDGTAQWQRGGLHKSDACYIGFESHQGEATHQELPFFGAIDEVRVFGRALTPDEVRRLASTDQ